MSVDVSNVEQTLTEGSDDDGTGEPTAAERLADLEAFIEALAGN